MPTSPTTAVAWTTPLPAVPLAPVENSRVETIRVLHLINGEHYAGAERVQDLLALGLPEFGFSVGFACVKLGAFDAMRESRAAPLHDMPMRSRFDLRAARAVAQLLRREDYLLLHAHTVRTAMIGGMAATMAGVPMIYHAHSPTARNIGRRWRDWFNAVVERRSLRRAVRVIAVSEAMADYIAGQGYEPSRIRVVPNGVPQPIAPTDRRPPEGRWTLGVVALFRPRKGLEVLLDALAELTSRGMPVHLRAVGAFESPTYQAEIMARVERLRLSDRVTWTGFSRNVPAELVKMDLLVLPSLFGEGLPMVVLEAMAAGTPVVATRVEGVPEAIRDGVDGVLAAPGDTADLTRAIAHVVGGQYDWGKLCKNALERYAAKFSDRAMAAGVAGVYRELFGY